LIQAYTVLKHTSTSAGPVLYVIIEH